MKLVLKLKLDGIDPNDYSAKLVLASLGLAADSNCQHELYDEDLEKCEYFTVVEGEAEWVDE